jgi:SpoVK/Ycf46/Vps4 family AAA+-type ATPase
MDLKQGYFEHLEDATKENRSLIKHVRDYQTNSKDLSDRDFLVYMRCVAEKIIDEGKVPVKELPNRTQQLLNYIKNRTSNVVCPGSSSSRGPSAMAGGRKDDVIECKEPLTDRGVTFDNIAGQADVKDDILRNYIYPYRYPELFPLKTKGILFYGPGGVGKTLLAKAATAEIQGAAFFSPTPGDLRGKYEGDTEKGIARAFECAAEIIGKPIPHRPGEVYTSAILFIDEFDSLASARGDDPGMRRSVNSLLQAMDGMKSSPNVSVIAATNLPWDLDSTIIRRFTAKIFVDLPDDDAREWIIRDSILRVYNSPRDKELARRRRPGEKAPTVKVMEKRYNPEKNGYDIVWINDAFKSIKDYGEALCTETISGWMSSKSVLKMVDAEFVRIFARDYEKGLGMNEKARKVKEQIVKGEYVDPDTIDETYFFGYSASDVAKIMDTAVQLSASRALDGAFASTEVKLSEKDGVNYYVSTSADPTKRPKEIKDLYVLSPSALERLKKKYDGYFNQNFILMTQEQTQRAVNYSLCQGDLEKAKEIYAPTVSGVDYVRILLYKHLGISPKK